MLGEIILYSSVFSGHFFFVRKKSNVHTLNLSYCTAPLPLLIIRILATMELLYIYIYSSRAWLYNGAIIEGSRVVHPYGG